MKRLVRFLKPYRLQVILGPVFKLIEAIFELIVPLVMADMIDVGVANRDIGYLLHRGGLLVLLGFVGLMSSLTCQTMASKASQGVGTDLRREVFHQINTFSWKELDRFGTPTLITRMTSDINQLQTAVAMLIRLVVRAPFLVIGAVIMAMRIDLHLSVIFLAIVPLVALVLYLVMSRSVPFFKTIQKKTDHVALVTRENLSGARVIRAFRKQNDENSRFVDACDDLAGNSIHIGKLNAILAPFSFLVLNLGIVAILWFGGKRVDTGYLTQGQVVAFINYMTQILLALVVVANLVVTFTKAAASASRINEIFDTKPSITSTATENVKPVADAPRIEFKSVTFAYHKNAAPALKNISLSIAPGESIGIIGGTGSGKSTMVQLLPRLYDVTEGEILVDGVNVKDYPLSQLHWLVSMVPQGNLLFSGTIRSNLCWRNKNATDEELWNALHVAQAEDFVRSIPAGLDAPVNAGGTNFSGGQRQRLTIARALVGKAEVLVLDDSSSALDYATDAALEKALSSLSGDMSVISVSQRVSTVRRCSRIVVMDHGEIAGIGSHSELLHTCPTYQEICASQLKQEEMEA